MLKGQKAKLEPTPKNPYLGLTLKQREFVLYLVKTGEKSEAAYHAFDTKSKRNAKIIAYNYINRPKVKKAIDYALRLHIGEIARNLKIRNGLEATKYALTDGGYKKVPDHQARLGYLDMLHKLMGNYKPEKKIIKEVKKIDEKAELDKLKKYNEKEND